MCAGHKGPTQRADTKGRQKAFTYTYHLTDVQWEKLILHLSSKYYTDYVLIGENLNKPPWNVTK